MKTIKLRVFVLSALALAALAAWFIAFRHGGRPDANPVAAVVSPPRPAVMIVKTKKKAGGKNASQKGTGLVKVGEVRKRRVSKLQEPGEALGGGNAALVEAGAKQ
ncbi:MAG: hypothetical protein A2218_01780 [Elusimicrobia bacterium RIFOXYA2_FULL_53_38]|nr:MAG: hypothetical protein A2218_01780 [Elusimicrobia bacterium RIFOXYA2_FULL_53_38]